MEMTPEDVRMYDCLIELGKLSGLSIDLRTAFSNKNIESYDQFLEKRVNLGAEKDNSDWLPLYVDSMRRDKNETRDYLRVSRKMIFASGFSAFERFLVLSFTPDKPKAYFKEIKKAVLDETGINQLDAQAQDDWKRCDLYRIARNKIVHQLGFISALTADKDERSLLAHPPLGISLLDEDKGPDPRREILVQETSLSDILAFLERFAHELHDTKMRGKC